MREYKIGDFVKINNMVTDTNINGVSTGITYGYGIVTKTNVETRPDCVYCIQYSFAGYSTGFGLTEKSKLEIIYNSDDIKTEVLNNFDEDYLSLGGNFLEDWKKAMGYFEAYFEGDE